MKEIINEPDLGEIVYEESFWTGKKSLSIAGKQLNRINKNTFRFDDGKYVLLKGNILTGIKITIEKDTYLIIKPPRWYEILIAILTFAITMVWGSSPTLCQILPLVGGAIGGAIAGLFAMLSLIVMKTVKKPIFKILIGLGFFVGLVIVLFILALVFIGLI